MEGKTLTIIGTVDPVSVVGKLRKFWAAEIVLVGPKEEAKKEEEKSKEEEPKKEGEDKKEETKKEEEEKKPMVPIGMVMPYRPYYHPPPMHTYYHSIEENPNACVIC